MDRIIHEVGPSIINTFTVETLIKTLEKHVGVIDCAIRGHLTIESDIIIMVTPSNPRKFQALAKVCHKEAEKITLMIQTSSPRINSELSSSVLTSAVLVPDLYLTTRSYYSTSTAASVPYNTMCLVLFEFYFVYSFEIFFTRVS